MESGSHPTETENHANSWNTSGRHNWEWLDAQLPAKPKKSATTSQEETPRKPSAWQSFWNDVGTSFKAKLSTGIALAITAAIMAWLNGHH